MKKSKPGEIITIHKVLNKAIDPVGFFNNLRKKQKNTFLLESADIIEKYGDKSIGCVEPCIRIVVKEGKFEIQALDYIGESVISYIKGDFQDIGSVISTTNKISGIIKKQNSLLDEDSKLKSVNVFDILRKITFKFHPTVDLGIISCGIFGMISYDAIDYFEDLPQPLSRDEIPELEFYYANKLFVIDHKNDKTYIIANHLATSNTSDISHCYDTLSYYEDVFNKSSKYMFKDKINNNKLQLNVSDHEFKNLVSDLKKHIEQGNIYQCVISRNFSIKTNQSALDTYSRLKSINPAPYMFYFDNGNYTLLGSSPETCLKVSGKQQKTVELRPIAGTIERGKINKIVDSDLDNRYQLDLILDKKELSEHCMLIDLARNDIARVSLPFTKHTPQLLHVEKSSNVQHLVSSVKGKLRPDLDALHAYAATMNMGTLTGAPKIMAMGLIRDYEKRKRGPYGGAICYMTPDGEFDSCIIIRSILTKDNMASTSAGAGIVFDSDPDKETKETMIKAQACLAALGVKT